MLIELLVACCGCARRDASTSGSGGAASAQSVPSFTDVTEAAGVTFRHRNGAFGQKYMPESTGSGCAFFDADGDGRLDLLAMNGCDWPGRTRTPSRCALYRNAGGGRFEEITATSGLPADIYGMGVAAADYDNDGDQDLYLTCLGPNFLMRNRGDGTFEDVTARAGVAGAPVEPGGLRWKWSSSAAWVDYDRDGWLDLFVCGYVRWTPATDIFCRGRRGEKAYCAPTSYAGVPCTLYRNRGDGAGGGPIRFEDVSASTGIADQTGKSLGVAVADVNDDSWPDIVVANDMTPNFLFLNEAEERGPGGSSRRFQEVASEWGIGVGESGKAKAGMGIDAADWQNSGRPGVLIGNFSHEALSLFAPDRGEGLVDVTYPYGMGEASLLSLTFGLCFLDANLDGWLDAFIGNGHIDDTIEGSQITYRQRPLLLLSDGGRGFREVGLAAGDAMARPMVVRGLAQGDYDGDGDPDLALLWNNVGLRLYRNDWITGSSDDASGHWIGLNLVGTRSNRDGLGARVRVVSGGLTQTRWARSGSSYLSASQALPPIGLGDRDRVESVTIDWPSGVTERLTNLAAGRYHRIREGETARAANPGRNRP